MTGNIWYVSKHYLDGVLMQLSLVDNTIQMIHLFGYVILIFFVVGMLAVPKKTLITYSSLRIIPPPPQVHFVFAMTNDNYLPNVRTFELYAQRNPERYQVHVLKFESPHVNWHRHKRTLGFLESLKPRNNTWVAMFDGDHGVVNFEKDFWDTYVNPFQDRDIIMAERFQGEIMASSYILKLGDYAIEFEREWSRIPEDRPSYVLSMRNSDQGPLHYLVLNRLAPGDWSRCPGGMAALRHARGLQAFVKCVRWLLNQTGCRGHDWSHFGFFGREESWSRDGWLTNYRWDENDWSLHALKLDLKTSLVLPEAYPNEKTGNRSEDIYWSSLPLKKPVSPVTCYFNASQIN
jgi:hypothetical protein